MGDSPILARQKLYYFYVLLIAQKQAHLSCCFKGRILLDNSLLFNLILLIHINRYQHEFL